MNNFTSYSYTYIGGKVMVKVNESSSNSLLKILKGSILAIATTLIILLIYAIILTYTSVNEMTIPTVIIITTALSILIGSQITTSKIKKNGIINGMFVGIIYIMFLYIISSTITKNFSLNNYSIIMIAISIATGGLGGIIGVNRK